MQGYGWICKAVDVDTRKSCEHFNSVTPTEVIPFCGKCGKSKYITDMQGAIHDDSKNSSASRH